MTKQTLLAHWVLLIQISLHMMTFSSYTDVRLACKGREMTFLQSIMKFILLVIYKLWIGIVYFLPMVKGLIFGMYCTSRKTFTYQITNVFQKNKIRMLHDHSVPEDIVALSTCEWERAKHVTYLTNWKRAVESSSLKTLPCSFHCPWLWISVCWWLKVTDWMR